MKLFWIFLVFATSSIILHDAEASIFDCHHLDEILTSNHLLRIVPTWYKRWRVSFQIKPLGKVAKYANIFHATAGGNCCNNGQRIPAIWFQPNSFGLHIRHSINNHGNGGVDTSFQLPANKYSSVVVQQEYTKGKYVFSVFINGKVYTHMINNNPKRYHNVRLYSSNPWDPEANALVKNLVYETHKGPDFVWECNSHATPWNAEGGGNNAFLDRHNVRCPASHGLRSFRLVRKGDGNYQYRFECCQLPYHCEKYVEQHTNANYDGDGNMVFIDRHNLQCANNYITSFRLQRPSSSTIQYKYSCCVLSKQKTCYVASTPFTDDGNGNTEFLDRQIVKCSHYHHFLTYFHLERDGSHKHVRYNYQCCRVAEKFKNGKLTRNRLVGVVYKWHKQWRVSFKIKPVSKHSPWTSILHFTAGGNCCDNGQRVPAIFFIPNTFRLHVRHSINNNGNGGYDAPHDLPTNKFTAVVVEQMYVNGKYTFKVILDGKTMYSAINNHASYYYNVKVYASDPWSLPADAVVTDLKYSSHPGPAHPSWQCSNKATPWNSEGSGSNHFLDRHHVTCGTDHALRSFRLFRSGKGTYQYRYRCCKLPVKCARIQNKATNGNDDGDGSLYHLDRHFLKCSNRHNFITGFRLGRPSSGTIQYSYSCCVQYETKTCYNGRTKWDSGGDGNTVFLDRQNVACSKPNYGLTAFKLERSGSNVRYYYECCTL